MSTTAVLFAADVLGQSIPLCLADSFYGIYGEHAIFKPAESHCLTHIVPGNPPVVVPLPGNDQLVWIQESAIDDSLQTSAYTAEVDDFLEWLRSDGVVTLHSEYQAVFESPPTISLLNHDSASRSALVAVPNDAAAHALSSFLPRYWKPSPLPPAPIAYRPVPERAVEHIRHILTSLRFDPSVAGIVNGLSKEGMRDDIRYLTNEDGTSGIESRHSFAHGSRLAAAWLKAQFEDTGATCELREFLQGFAPNVICRYTGTADSQSLVLISGHYDSRGSFGSSRAPGGNDDGSGTISLLAIARRIKEVGLTFHSNVELVAFAGEEQGLLGSKAYAQELRARDANVTLMIQADMLAYHALYEPPQLGLPIRIGTPEVTELVSKIADIYSPELTVGYTSACCSDHQSFHQQGYPATQVFERAGPIADPMYHNSGDVSERPGYDLLQVWYISRVQFATLLHTAGFDLEW